MHRPCFLLSFLLALSLAGGLDLRGADDAANTLSAADRAEGWRLLFDGKTSAGWRAIKKTAFPTNGWEISDGCIRHLPKGGGGDIVTSESFSSYDLRFEWKMNPGGNSGLKYFVEESRAEHPGHEYQLLGPVTTAEAVKDLKHATASFYDVLPVQTNALPRPPGEWNQSRIVVRKAEVEHWLNGQKVLTYNLESPAVKAAISASKFRNVSRFGSVFPHPILLQDHGGDAWFRNLKIRTLPE
ncbi:MAG: DUF1080 domain-containing protein [Verrucomicrobiales bacterium]|nr:DUF1080 domain-containing protein [Verrucomicrobiales bacterium]